MTFSLLIGGCSEGLDTFIFFFKQCRDCLGGCRPVGNYSLQEQTEPNQIRSLLWSLGTIQLCKRLNQTRAGSFANTLISFHWESSQNSDIVPENRSLHNTIHFPHSIKNYMTGVTNCLLEGQIESKSIFVVLTSLEEV